MDPIPKAFQPKPPLRHVWDTLLKGLAAVLPVTLTLYLIYWLALVVERLFRLLITLILPDAYYLPGMGLVVGVILLFFIGLAVDAWIVQRVFRIGDNFLERIPLVKSIYGSLRDFMEYFASEKQRSGLKQVVLVTVGEARLLGFVTREKITDTPGLELSEDIVAVYFPMSYQIGGYTAYLPRSQVQVVDMSIEDAMRLVLTAGVSVSREPEEI